VTQGFPRIEVGIKPEFPDAIGNSLKKTILEDLGIRLSSVRIIEAYTLNFPLPLKDLDTVASQCFSDRVLQNFTIVSRDGHLARKGFDFIVEVGFRPGVTDNVGMTAKEAMEDTLRLALPYGHKVFTSKQFLFRGKALKEDILRIVRGILANELIGRWSDVLTKEEFRRKGLAIPPPEVRIPGKPVVEYIPLPQDSRGLIDLSSSRLFSLNLIEMKVIRDYFGRNDVIENRKAMGLPPDPTDVELEVLAQTWSEHCKHKIFNAKIHVNNTGVIDSLFKTYIVRATQEIRRKRRKNDLCVSVFTDNAGIIRFNKNHNLVFKVETHNAPSALDPYGGALTGIVGVNRDPMGTGLGAKLIFNTNVFCFGPPFVSEKSLPKGILHPLAIFKGVRRGVEHGGNKIGIPTVNGTVLFNECYTARPLVFCGTGGIMPKAIAKKPSHAKTIKDGDLIVMTGGRIGKDGIHGATFSSAKLDESSPMSAVQIGAPIVQKNMMDAILEARDKGLYTAITDNGAGGLSSSVGEMARLCGGFVLHLEKAPLKYQGLHPWEILLSEAQERMSLAVPPDRIKPLLALFRARGVEATVLGFFTSKKKFHVLYKGKTIAYMDMDFVHDGLPQMELDAEIPPLQPSPPPDSRRKNAISKDLAAVLSDLHVASKEWVVRQYDHEVQGNTIIKPLIGALNDGPSDASVIRPIPDSWQGVAVANDITPGYGKDSCYHMTACSIDACIRKLIAVGASLDGIALLDNFCWPYPVHDLETNPDGKKKLGRLVESAKALYDLTTLYGTPLISGKDSMANDRVVEGKKYSIMPTILISGIGIVRDVRKCISMDAKCPGDLVYVLGETRQETGSSVYENITGGQSHSCPIVRGEENKKLYKSLEKAISSGLVSSCHAITDGGLGVALAETSFAGMLGMSINLRNVPHQGISIDDILLFSESTGRFVVTIAPSKKKKFEIAMKGVKKALVGKVRPLKDGVTITGLKGKRILRSSVESLKESWQKPLRW